MKHLNKILTVAWMVVVLSSCKKTANNESDIIYEQTIKDVKLNEPILLSFGKISANKKVSWTATPSTSVEINAVNDNATIVFTNSGEYIIEATVDAFKAKYKVIVGTNEYTNYGTGFNVIASKFYGIKPNEIISFKAVNVGAGQSINPNFYPGNISSLNVNQTTKTVDVSFSMPGFYEVVIDNGTDYVRRTIWVDDANNPNLLEDSVRFILGDKLLVKPEVIIDNGIEKLQFTTTTKKKYHCNTDAILSHSNDKVYMLDFAGVAIANEPCSTPGTATSVNKIKKLGLGNYPFTVNFRNEIFKGNLLIDINGYHFTWNDASVVDIQPRDVK